jgi:ABC-type tungstate transport system permease subunit
MYYIPRLSRIVYVIPILVGAALCPLHALAGPAIVLASTTSVEDSGLLDRILPLFTKSTGIEVRVVAQGTGQALQTARRGDADLVLVHDPEAEQKFISEGYGVDRRQIAWNEFRDRRTQGGSRAHQKHARRCRRVQGYSRDEGAIRLAWRQQRH